MTDTAYPATSLAGPELLPPPAPVTEHYTPHIHHDLPQLDGAIEEDDGEISCFCGFLDDDGNTVQCDKCNRWQHIICYYPEFQKLPDDLQHYCVECYPRDFDPRAATARQREAKNRRAAAANGAKRQPTKSHRKKAKESPYPEMYTNGWPLDTQHQHERHSTSPRDQPPPAKRPKTSHQTSNSTTTPYTASHNRKRNGSTVHPRCSTSHSPGTFFDMYSEDFVRCYTEDNYTFTDANLLNALDVGCSMSKWLQDPDEVLRVTNGVEQSALFMRWDGRIEEITNNTQVGIRHTQDQNVVVNGSCPMWKYVTVEEPIAIGACIGELRGHVGFKQEYFDDPANRWLTLRHPEPFVFFHPNLPIYLDARNEGTELRYIRRSCDPNARLQILVTEGTEYHFCFMATQQIEPEQEVAIPWDTAEGMPESLMRRNGNGMMPAREKDFISQWVSNVLADCGPCACQRVECMMNRFDRRGMCPEIMGDGQTLKMPTYKRQKRNNHISPINTGHAFNSRSGSEARRTEQDEEPTDSRSGSGSMDGGGSASRDITPNTHYSANGSATVPELSERERKKMMREEEIFRKQEEESAGKSKKKRNSAGSNLNTPSANSSTQMGFSGPSTLSAPPRQASNCPIAKSVGKRPAKPVPGPPKTPSKAKSAPGLKPVYCGASTQCDLDKEEAEHRASIPKSRITYISVPQMLRERCAANNAKRRAHLLASKQATPQTESDQMDFEMATAEPLPEPPAFRRASSAVFNTPEAAAVDEPTDTVMGEAVHIMAGQNSPPSPHDFDGVTSFNKPASPPAVSLDVPSHPPSDPPPLPWPLQSSSLTALGEEAKASSPTLHQTPNLHVEMPPPQANPFALATSLITGTLGPFALSPATLTPASTPMFSPTINAAVNPSSARKKLSLSDYTKRKAKDKEPEANHGRESSPLSTGSGSVVPPLRRTSSEAENAAEQDSPARREDVNMVDRLAGAAETT